MSDINLEKYKREMNALGQTYGRIGNVSFDEVKYVKSKKGEFIIGTFGEKEDVAENSRTDVFSNDAYQTAESMIVCMSLKNGQLYGEPLIISSRSNSGYNLDAGPRDVNVRDSAEVVIAIGSKNVYEAHVDKYKDVTDSSAISEVVVLGRTTSTEKDKKTAIQICDCFLEPKGEASRLEKEEKEREKRVKRYRKLREMVMKKRAKIAEEQAKRREKLSKEKAKIDNQKAKKMLHDFLR